MLDYEKLYNTNEDFKRYIDRNCKDYGLTVIDALKMKLFQSVGDMYAEKSESKKTEIKIGCGC